MTQTENEDKFEWPDLSVYGHKEKIQSEWQHDENANTVPDWALPVLVLIALALFIVLVHSGTLKPFIQ